MTEYRAIVIGGGVAGASIAYHLTSLGWREVLLLERDRLTSGTTFHSAGLVGQLRSSVSLTRMMMYGTDLYRQLLGETGTDPGWHEVGSLRLASSKARMEELTRLAGWGQTFGLPLEIISTGDAREMFPLLDATGVEGAAFLPTDGWLDPSGLTEALAAGARSGGAEIATGTRVTGIDVRAGRVRGVMTEERGPVRADIVINAGGIFAHQIGRLAGVEVPVVPFAHQYLLTAPIEGVEPDIPTLRDPDRLVYLRQEAGGSLHVGGYERTPAPWMVDEGPPHDFNNQLLPEDWPRFEPLAEAAASLIPALGDADIVRMINGPEAFTPDGEFILGASEVPGFFVAAGFCAHGVAGAGGIGKVMADWIVHGEPEWDLWRMDVRRFGPQYASRPYALARSYEVYATYYDIHYPGEERRAGRPLKTPPTYGRLADLGAVFGEKSGWERANWFGVNEDPALEGRRPRGWAGEHWSTAIPVEHLVTRERAGLFDESSFAKLEVSGEGAAAFLQRVCANDVDRAPGSVVYTQMLNTRGGIESDLTVTRLRPDRFLLVTGTAFGAHDLGWIRTQLDREADRSVDVRDITASLACLGLWGPLARRILGPLTPADLSNRAFPYLTARSIVIGDVPCLASRVTYVGELGWELYPSIEFAGRLFEILLEAGEEHGMVPAGYRAIDSLRLEKGYRAWGSDITPEDTPLEAGLGFAVRDGGGFVGDGGVAAQRAAGVDRTLACLILDDPTAMVLGNEPVFHEGSVVARVTSGGIGYAVERSIAYAYVPVSLAREGEAVDVEVFGERVRAAVARSPIWDPTGDRIRA